MQIEHLALNVEDPPSVARWYVEHLGFTVQLRQEASPFAHFLADDRRMMIEIYRNPEVAVPDYRAINPAALHLAFTSQDVAADRARLIAAGAEPVGDVATMDNGTVICMLRDPWGLAIQLVKRGKPLV